MKKLTQALVQVLEDILDDSDNKIELKKNESIISPSKEFLESVKKNYDLEGKWKISGKGLNVFYNQQPKTLLELNDTFNVDNYFNNYNSTLIIKQSPKDPRYILCMATPDKSTGVSYRTSYGFQPGYINLVANNNFSITIQDYDDQGRYILNRFHRDPKTNEIIKIQGEYVESGYNNNNRYQVPTCGAIELEKINNSTDTDFIKNSKSDNVLTYKNIINPEILKNFTENDYYFYDEDYSSEFKSISSTRYNSLRQTPLLNKNNNIHGKLYTNYEYSINKGINKCISETIIVYFKKEYTYNIDKNYSIEPFEENVDIKQIINFNKIAWIPSQNEDIGTGTFKSTGKIFKKYLDESGKLIEIQNDEDIKKLMHAKLNNKKIAFKYEHVNENSDRSDISREWFNSIDYSVTHLSVGIFTGEAINTVKP